MNRSASNAGGATLWLIVTLATCALSAYFLGLVGQLMTQDKPVMPLIIMGLILAPVTFVTQLIFKFNDMKKLKGINREERRRLESIVNSKVLRLVLIDIFFLLSTTIVGVCFYVAPFFPELNLVTWTLRAAGFLVAASVFTFITVLLGTRKISDFEAKISNRALERKHKAALLKRLKEVEKDKP